MPEHHEPDLLESAYPYALDALTDSEREAVEQLLNAADENTAADFRSAVHEIRETLAVMTTADAHPAPPGLEAALQRALDDQLGTTPPQSPPEHRVRGRRWALAAAALIAMIAIGAVIAVTMGRFGESGRVTAEQVLSHADTHGRTARLTGGGTITVRFSRELNTATVSFVAVPDPPTGHAYQLWLILPAGQPQSVTVFAALPTDRAPLLVRLDHAELVALSVEPAGGSPQPTTAPVVAVQII
ncbi:anti-sigma factor [Nocardia sp. NBC_01503]|uniref:anti-sigma factor n=1 Tax=Nocardia sp. NBC_01503 TaxID=2975997 RepID=UPI002E7B9F94|nr:anti-sigma factor [Nocardia sp. NBC_01503]WTL30616.1 anti-sigma factor [Nocardia sp. NBC_01503]